MAALNQREAARDGRNRRGARRVHPWNWLCQATGCVPPKGGRREATQGGHQYLPTMVETRRMEFSPSST